MSTYELINVNQTSPEYQAAMELHQQILANGIIASNALVGLCAALKKMRDSRQYIHLGYQSFDDYAVNAVNMKARQAYNYISTYEKLGPDLLQSNASLGITKLELLSQVPESRREEVLEVADDLSTREMKDLVAELTKAREQLTFLEAQNETLAQDVDGLAAGKDDAKRQIQTLEKRIVQLEADRKAESAMIEKAKKDAVKAAEADIKSKEEFESAKKIDAARREGIETGRKAAEQGLQAISQEKVEALAKAQELEKKLQVQGNQDTVLFAYLFDELQINFNKLTNCLSKIVAADPAVGQKYRGAIHKYLGLMSQKLEQ
jgi:DNA repair exonuclease SbcCD ATPase subunit